MSIKTKLNSIRKNNDCQEQKRAINKYIGSKIRWFRKVNGLNQESLGSLLATKITQQQMCKYESGTDNIPANMLVEISQILGVTIEAFIPPHTKKTSVAETSNDTLERTINNTVRLLEKSERVPKKSLDELENILRDLKNSIHIE